MFTYYDKTKYVCKQVIYIDKHAQSWVLADRLYIRLQ